MATPTLRNLFARKPGIFLDTIDWHFRSPAKNREHRPVFQEVDGVIAPLAIGDHAPVEIEDTIQFEPIEGNVLGRERRCAALRPPHLAWVCFA